MLNRTAEEARAFIANAAFHWHQGFDLVPGVRTPGGSNTQQLIERCQLPADLHGRSVLDIGTNNGALCFEAERRGADRVVGVDIFPVEAQGFSAIRAFLGSNAEFLQGSVYDLWHLLDETFDIVVFLGVLYHLRHPLLALDTVRAFTRGTVRCLLDWCWSCGLAPELLSPSARQAPKRCLIRATPTAGEPEDRTLSYERPVRVTVAPDADRTHARQEGRG